MYVMIQIKKSETPTETTSFKDSIYLETYKFLLILSTKQNCFDVFS